MIDFAGNDRNGRKNAPLFTKEKTVYVTRLQQSVCVSLLLTLIILIVWQRRKESRKPDYNLNAVQIQALDLPPQTRNRGTPVPPLMPQIPIPSEEEFIPLEETIEMTELDAGDDLAIPDFPRDIYFSGDEGGDAAVVSSPEKVIQNGYVQLSLLINAHGWVDSVVVVENTTNSKEFELQAVKIAYRTRYLEESSRIQAKHWIERKFEYSEK